MGDIDGFGSAYYDPSQAANIFGFAHMVDNSDRVVYDSNVEDAFVVYKGDEVTKFPRTVEGLYAYAPTQRFFDEVAEKKRMQPPQSTPKDHLINAISTVRENMKMFTKRQQAQAK